MTALPKSEPDSRLEIIQLRSLQPGPRLIVTGAVHGNETAGTIAIRRMIEELRAKDLTCGSVTFVPIVNVRAYNLGQRAVDANLNRDLREHAVCVTYEDRVANVICPLLREHDVLLDLHSFRRGDFPFVLVGPVNNTGEIEPFNRQTEEQALALALGLEHMVYGWLTANGAAAIGREAALGGAPANVSHGVGMTEYMRSQGGYALTVECGQHDDPNGPEVGYQMIAATLGHLGIVADAPTRPRPRVTGIRIAAALLKQREDETLAAEFQNFDKLAAGDVITQTRAGPAQRAPADGYILFPAQHSSVGDKMAYFAEPSARFS